MSDAMPSRLDDYLDVFVSPSELFRRRSDGKFGQAIFVLVLLVAILFFATKSAMAPIMDAEMARSMASSARTMTPEQLEAAKKFGGIFYGISILVATPIAVLLLGLVVFLVARLLSGTLGYAQGATIAVFSMFPRLIESIVGAVQALLMDESKLTSRFSVSLGAGRFLDPAATNPVLMAFAGRLDLFTIWVTVLIAIGLKVMGKLSTNQAVMGAGIVWLIGAVPVLVQGLTQQ